MEKFTIIIVEDVPLELRGTEGILRTEVPAAQQPSVLRSAAS